MIRYLALILLLTLPAYAGDPKFWGDYPPEVHAWFPTVMDPVNTYRSCCGEGDAYLADITGEDPLTGDILVNIPDGKGILPDNYKTSVPRNRLQWRYGNPLDKNVIFMSASGAIFCFIPTIGL